MYQTGYKYINHHSQTAVENLSLVSLERVLLLVLNFYGLKLSIKICLTFVIFSSIPNPFYIIFII